MRWLLLLCLAVCLVSATPASAAREGPFADVPVNHWGYDAVQSLSIQGYFTGYPNGTFSGRRALTRYEFAVAIQRLLQETRRVARENAWPDQGGPNESESLLRRAVLWRLGIQRRPPPLLINLVRLVQEFGAELAMLGQEPEPEIRRLDAPYGQDPPVPPRRRRPSDAWRRGVDRARAEWDAGRPVFYQEAPTDEELFIDPELGIPVDPFTERAGPDSTAEIIKGHNDEVYRLILEHGLPASARRECLELIQDPEKAMSDPAHPPSRLDESHRSALARRQQLQVRAWFTPTSTVPTLEVSFGEKTLDLAPFIRNRWVSRVDVLAGPPQSDLLFLHFVESSAEGAEAVYQVVDLRTGKPLNTKRSEE